MIPVKINPNLEERQIIDRLVVADLRTPEQVCRWLIREEARRRGWSAPDSQAALPVVDASAEALHA